MMIRLIFVFFIFSFTGWIIELVYRSIYERRLVNPGFHKGPWLPLYGLSGSLIYLFSEGMAAEPMIVRILFYYLSCTAFEFIAGIFLEKVFHRRYWDYSSNRLNIMGLICPLYSAAWIIISIVVDEFIIPVVQLSTSVISASLMTKIDALLLALFLADFLVSSGIIKENRHNRLKNLFS